MNLKSTRWGHAKTMHAIYVGDSRNVQKRIKINHCSGNVEASALRRHIAQAMGYRLKRENRPSGSTRVRIDLPDPSDGERRISDYMRSGKWRVITCDNYELANDFQWYVIDRLKPRLNRDRKEYPKAMTTLFERMFQKLLESRMLNCSTIGRSEPKSGVYVFYHQEIPCK